MNNLFRKGLIIIISGVFYSMISCTPLTCFEETEAFVKASFYDNTTKLMRTPDSITIYGLNMETNKLYNNIKKLQPALFPLNPSAAENTYIIIINGKKDTISFSYNSYPHLISKECGYSFFFNLESDPVHTFNSIKYIYRNNSNITTVNEENIRIYY
jgi:hypothetical protein